MGEVIGEMVSMFVYVLRYITKSVVSLDVNEISQQVHNALMLTRARMQAGDNRLVIAVAQYLMVAPGTTPKNSSHQDWQQLLNHNWKRLCLSCPLDLEPPHICESPAAPGARSVGGHLEHR